MDFKIIELHDNLLKVFEDGTIQVQRKNKDEYYNKLCSLGNGYFKLELSFGGDVKMYMVHRIVAMAFLGFDIDSKMIVKHKNENRIDNRVSNLRLMTYSENSINRSNIKGYSWNTRSKKWCAQITKGGQTYRLGRFDDEADARQAYLNAREIHYAGLI